MNLGLEFSIFQAGMKWNNNLFDYGCEYEQGRQLGVFCAISYTLCHHYLSCIWYFSPQAYFWIKFMYN